MRETLEHLRLLAIFHYVVAGLSALCACFPVVHLAMGVAIVTDSFEELGLGPRHGETPPEFFGWIIIVAASGMMMAGWTFAIALAFAGRMLRRRRGYTYCLVMAAIACAFMPFGVVLGVFTLIVLLRPGVKELFNRPGGVPAADDAAGGELRVG